MIRIALTVLTVVFGTLSAYLRENQKLRNRAVEYIAEAEEIYKDVTKAGGQKFSWVVETLYNLVPPVLKIFITKKLIEAIVQNTFEGIEQYAKMQLDKAIDKAIDKSTNKAEMQ